MEKQVLTEETARGIIESRIQITEPGYYELKVTNVSAPQEADDKGNIRKIVNLSAMTDYHVTQANELLEKGEFDNATNAGLSTSPRIGKDFIPSKGEFVKARIDYSTTKAGITALFVQGITEIPTKTGKKVSLKPSEQFEQAEETTTTKSKKAVEAEPEIA